MAPKFGKSVNQTNLRFVFQQKNPIFQQNVMRPQHFDDRIEPEI